VTTIVKGDQRCATIAAASVLAKVHRDALMVSLHEEFHEYQWARNKGYGAPEHLEALRRRGASEHHRKSWNLPKVTPAHGAT
jgi:ribonuclease HII